MTMLILFFKSMFPESRTSQENYYANPIISSSSNNLIENINIFFYSFNYSCKN